MFDIDVIKKEFGNLVGWRQNPDPQGAQLIGNILTSESSVYFNDQHAMLTFDNIASVANRSKSFVYADYDSETDYLKGAIAAFDGANFIKVNPSAAGDPTSSENWKPFDFLSYWIEQKTDAFILEAFNDWFYEKEKFGTAKSVLGYQMLFANPGEREVLLSQGVEVGLTINTRKSQSLAYQFSKIALHFAEAGPIELKLFKNGVQIETETFEYTGSGLEQFDCDWKLFGSSTYRIIYEADGINNPIALENAEMPTSPYYSVQGYKDGADTYENYGIDAVISVNCDYTNIIVAQKAAFRNLICKAVAKGMLREIIYNPNARNNRNESNVDEKQLLYEADGDARAYSWNSSGLGNAYRKALKGLTFDRSKIDRFCLPCRRRGLKYTTTG